MFSSIKRFITEVPDNLGAVPFIFNIRALIFLNDMVELFLVSTKYKLLGSYSITPICSCFGIDAIIFFLLPSFES